MKRLLLVDDDPDILEVLAELLQDRFELALARNGQEALEHVQQTEFDAVLLDLMMPIMDGQTFMTQLHELPNPPPVLLISAAIGLTRYGKQLGAQDWILKPFSFHELERKLEPLLAEAPPSTPGTFPS